MSAGQSWARHEAMAAVHAAQTAEWQLADDDPALPYVTMAIHALANARHLAAGGPAFRMPHPELALVLEARR